MVPQAHRAHVNIFLGLKKLIERAGMKPWPRRLQNLRESCATDWAGKHLIHESSQWLGHSPTVAAKHYLQSKDLHFKAGTGTGAWITAAKAEAGVKAEMGALSVAPKVQNRGQHGPAPKGTELKPPSLNPEAQRGCPSLCETVQPRATQIMGGEGFEPPAHSRGFRGVSESGAESGTRGERCGRRTALRALSGCRHRPRSLWRRRSGRDRCCLLQARTRASPCR